jgi:CRP-like cAMP-binding protein
MPTPSQQQLAAIDIFRGLSPPELAHIARIVRTRRWQAGHCFVNYRDESRDVYLILSGRVKVAIYSEDGREVAFREMKAGESFGEIAAIDGKPRSANVIALTEAEVGSITAAEFMDLVRRYPAVSEGCLRKLTGLVRQLSDRVEEFSRPVPERVCKELIRLAQANSSDKRTACLRPAPKHADIASRVNTHREAVSRLMSELARAGIVERRSGELVVHDIKRLVDHAARLHARSQGGFNLQG